MKLHTLLTVWGLLSFLGSTLANRGELRLVSNDSILVHGTVYLENSSNSIYDNNDTELSEIEVEIYEDVNNNNEIDQPDVKINSSITNSFGEYNLSIPKHSYIQVSNKVNSSSDDAVQNEPGGIMILDGVSAPGIREIGLRFTDINLPQSAKIESATLKITMAEGSDEFIEIIVGGETSNNATTFINEDYNIYTRPRTNSVVAWTSAEPRALYQEIEIDGIASVIQEIVDQSGWRKGNALVLIIADFDSEMFMFDGGFPAELIINYKNEEPENTSYIVAPSISNVNSTYDLYSEPFIFSKSDYVEGNQYQVDFGYSLDERGIEDPIAEEVISPNLQIWPNPTIGPIHINATGINDMDGFMITIYSMNGKLFNQDSLSFTNEGKAVFDLSHLSKGAYVVQIFNYNGVMFSEKLVVQ